MQISGAYNAAKQQQLQKIVLYFLCELQVTIKTLLCLIVCDYTDYDIDRVKNGNVAFDKYDQFCR